MDDYADLPATAPDSFSEGAAEGASDPWPPYQVLAPERQTRPLVFASPHSGNRYPTSFVAASRLDPLLLRRSEEQRRRWFEV